MENDKNDMQPPDRRRWMAVLARAKAAEIEAALAEAGGVPAYEIVKAPETGTVMIEGRAGGTGRRFNLGEATVSRSVVRLDDGTLGFSYALGHDRRKALLAAIADAVMQRGRDTQSAALAAAVARLGATQQQARDLASRKAAATKVDFFTLVRGD